MKAALPIFSLSAKHLEKSFPFPRSVSGMPPNLFNVPLQLASFVLTISL
jgi:hypothetical protein